MRAISRMSWMSHWLFAYLACCDPTGSTIARMLRELRWRNLKTPEGVYDWIRQATERRPDDLEEDFRRFYLTGQTIPL
jgi:hypothetical protein